VTIGLAQRFFFARRRFSSVCPILESSPRPYQGSFIGTPPSLFLAILLFTVGGCAIAPIDPITPLYSVPESADCLALFTSNEKTIEHAGTRDSQATRVPGFPFLRTSRFLSSLSGDLATADAREDWIEHLAALDAEGRLIEIRNLAPVTRPSSGEIEAIERCRTVLVRHALAEPAVFEEIRRRAVVPDSYRLWQRAAGLYPLTSLFVLAGVERLHDREGHYFTTDSESLTQSTQRIAYGSAAGETGEHPYDIVARTTLSPRRHGTRSGFPSSTKTTWHGYSNTTAPYGRSHSALEMIGSVPSGTTGKPSTSTQGSPPYIRVRVTRNSRARSYCSSITPCGSPHGRNAVRSIC